MQTLAHELLAEPKQRINNLPTLIASLTKSNESGSEVLRCLQHYFVGAFERGELSSKRSSNDNSQQGQQQSPAAVFETWLRRQYKSFVSASLSLIANGSDARTQVCALAALMECVRGEEAGVFNNELYEQVVEAVVGGQGAQPEVLGALLNKYAGNADVRYFTMRSIIKIATRNASAEAASASVLGEAAGGVSSRGVSADDAASSEDLARNLHDILTQLPPLEACESGMPSWCGAAEVGVVAAASDVDGSRQRKRRRKADVLNEEGTGQQLQHAKWASPKLQKKAYSDAWLAFLRLDLPMDTYKRVLTRLHDLVIPSCFNPLLLSDFLTHSLDKGGLVGMLSLNGIFILVTQYGLEYPNFYARLYALLVPEAFQAKYRARFFQLADAFLASSMVPAYTAASFVKRFARTALTASPTGALIALSFIHNIIRRHPACMQLIHRPPRLAAPVHEGSTVVPATPTTEGHDDIALVYKEFDVYDPDEPDPSISRAIESSLWELEALKLHNNPMVASFCGLLEKDLSDRRKTSELDISEMIRTSYGSMFQSESERRLKSVPTAFYQRAPAVLFDVNSASDFQIWVV